MSNQLLLRRRTMVNMVDKDKFLMFTSQQDGSTIALDKQGTPPAHDFEFSLDGSIFVPYTVGSVITLDTDESVWFRKNGTTQTNALNGTNSPHQNYYKFIATGSFICNGKLTALLGWWVNGYVGTALSSRCFNYLLGQSSIVSTLYFPETITTLADGVFDYCSSLIGELDLRNVTTIGGDCFRNTKFDTVYINSNLTSIGQYYNQSSGLNNLYYYGTIQDFVANYPGRYIRLVGRGINLYINDVLFEHYDFGDVSSVPYNQFKYIQSLKSVTLSSSITSIGNSAFAVTGLTSINLNNVTVVADYAFDGCTSLQNVNSISQLTQLGQYSFRNCPLSGTVSLNQNLTAIPISCFYGCYFTGDLVIPNNVTIVGASCFSGTIRVSNQFSTITFGISVSKLEYPPFAHNDNRLWVKFLSTTPPTLSYAASTNLPNSNKYYVPYSADHSILEAYKTAWPQVANKIFELDENGEIPT